MKYNNSTKAFVESQELIPGGVNSPVRAFKSVNCNPVFFDYGKGSKVYDIDGNEYFSKDKLRMYLQKKLHGAKFNENSHF